jgi:hypothetical protein
MTPPRSARMEDGPRPGRPDLPLQVANNDEKKNPQLSLALSLTCVMSCD